MAEAFLASLPKVGRGVLATEDQQCPVCMEEYGTMPSTTGIIERAVRLPCNHVLGSECISLWLTPSPFRHSNNTCPLCRHTLFEVSPSDTEPDDDDDDHDDNHALHMQIHVSLRQHIETLGHHLSLSIQAIDMAADIADRIHDLGPMGGRSLVEVAAGSLYMASFVMEEPRTLGAISREIAAAGMGHVGFAVIRRTYHWLYPYRRRLIRESLLGMTTDLTLDTVDSVLP